MREPPSESRGLTSLVLKFMAGVVMSSLVVGAIGYVARDRAEAVATSFVRSFGYAGMALGTLLADGLHFPVPPQFYMLLSVASGASVVRSFLAIAVASVAAGFLGFGVARFVAGWSWLERNARPYQEAFARILVRPGVRAAVVASLLPIPYSVLCYLCGLSRAPLRFLALLMACRVPKLGCFYYLVYLGWASTGGG